MPGICASGCAALVAAGHGADQAARCRDGAGASSTASTAPGLDDAPGIHDRDPVGEAGDDGEVVA